MKQSKKILAIVLAFLMLSTVLVGCKTKDDDGAGSNSVTTSGNNGEVVIEYDENGYEKDTLPDNLDYKGKEVNVFHWQERAAEDWLDEATPGNIVEEAVVLRQMKVEERLGVKFKINNTVQGAWGVKDAFLTALQGETDAGTSGIDLVGQYMPVAPAATLRGIYGDISDNPYINYSKPWWPKNVVETCSLGGGTYFITGDVTPTTITMLGQAFINLEMYESMGGNRAELYQTIKDGKWTMEYLKKMAVGRVGIDLSDTVLPLDRTYGILFDHAGCYDNLFYAGGFVTVTYDNDGKLVLSEDLESDRFATWFETCQNLLQDNPDVALGGAVFAEQGALYLGGSTFKDLFATGQALVYFNGVIADIQSTLRTLEIDFAVAPYPKYDENQEDYATITGFHNTVYGVPYNVGDFDLSCIVLEALASESYRSLIPTIYEDSFQARFFDTAENAEMLDIIRDSLTYDVGRTFSDQIGTFNIFRAAANGNTLSTMLARESQWQGKIDGINELFIS